MQNYSFLNKVLILLILLIGCSQKAKVTKSKLVLNLGNQISGAHRLTVNNKVITHLVVNVTGPSISNRLFYSWDACKGNNCSGASLLPEITFDVPTGPDRLVQVLAVFSPEGNSQSMDFYYGDTQKSLSKANEDIVVAISALYNTSSSSKTGSIAGRFQNNDGSYSTGKVSIEYQPPGNKPAMQITQGEIFQGWFEFFSLESVSLNYVLDNGQVIFSNTKLNDSQLSASEKVMQISLPNYWSVYKSSYGPNGLGQMTGNSWYSSSNDDLAIFGYFGSTNSQVVCYNNTEAAIKNNVVLNSNSIPVSISGFYKDEAATDPLYWKNSYDATNLSRIGGGVALSDSRCASATPFVNVFTVDYRNFQGDSSTLAGFNGPFKLLPGTPNSSNYPDFVKIYVTPTADANNYLPVKVKWNFLPDVFSSGGISGVTVFKKTYPEGSNMNSIRESLQDEDGFKCSHLTGYGFSEVATTPDSIDGITRSANLSALTASNLNTTAVIICPYKTNSVGDKIYFSTSLYTDLRNGYSQFSSLSGSVAASPSVSNNSNINLGGSISIHFDQPMDTLNTTITGTVNGDTITWINNNQDIVITFNSSGNRTVVITGVGAVSGSLPPMTYQFTVINPPSISSVSSFYGALGLNWNDYIKNNGSTIFSATPVACDKTLFESRFNSCIHSGIMRTFTINNPPSGLTCADFYIEDISTNPDPYNDNVFDWSCTQNGGVTRLYSYKLVEGAGLNNLIGFNGSSYAFDTRYLKVSIFDMYGNPTPIATSAPALWWSDTVTNVPGSYNLNTSNTVYVVNNDLNLTTETLQITSDKVSLTFGTNSGIPYSISKSDFTGTTYTPAAVSVTNSSFVWLEGMIIATPGVGSVDVNAKIVGLTNSHFSQIHSLYIETVDDFLGKSLSLIGSSHNFISESNIANYSATPSNTGIKLENHVNGTPSSFNTLLKVSTNNNFDGIVVSSPFNLLMDVISSNNTNHGISTFARNNVLVNILSSNNGNMGVLFDGVANNENEGNLLINATLNENLNGVKIGSYTEYNTLENILAYRNRNAGVHAEAYFSKLNSYYNLSLGSNLGNYQIELGSTASTSSYNFFSGEINIAPTAGATYCHVPGAGIHGIHPDCSTLTGASTGTLNPALSMHLFDYAFSGIASGSTDVAHSAIDWLGLTQTGLYTWVSATPNYNGRCELDHSCFKKDLRLSATPPTDGQQIALDINTVPVNSGDFKIHYWGTASNDPGKCNFPGSTNLSNVCNFPGYPDSTTCQAEPGGLWGTPACVTVSLKNAYELLGDGVGNDNGLCESNEDCVHSANIGTYQGEMYSITNANPLPTSSGGELTGIKLVVPMINGATPSI
ncbi:MAG: hypothetical protein U0T83_07495 [Bacteriovoracaceae bacterium]